MTNIVSGLRRGRGGNIMATTVADNGFDVEYRPAVADTRETRSAISSMIRETSADLTILAGIDPRCMAR